MTHSIVNRQPENKGSLDVVYATVDITSLDSAGVETVDPQAELGISGASQYGVSVVGQEDANKHIQWDHVAGQLEVYDGGGAATANNTDVGEVILEVTGF